MASIRARKDTNKLYYDFTYKGVRCREQTALLDNKQNRKRLDISLKRIEAEIALGSFEYEKYFPHSTNLAKIKQIEANEKRRDSTIKRRRQGLDPDVPTLQEFSETWFNENEVRWRTSTKVFMRQHADLYVLPRFGEKVVSDITRAEVLAFRSDLAKAQGLKGKPLSARTVNAHMLVLKTLLSEAAARYQFMSPVERIQSLKIKRSDVQPFTLGEVQKIIDVMPDLYRHYVAVRFFTGMRSSEVDGLLWSSIDWTRKEIVVETSAADDEELKNESSYRAISMNGLVYDALVRQKALTGPYSRYVFCNREGSPIDSANFSKRIWRKALDQVGVEYRRPYQMRHTAATLWLASGEAPEWIARQLGHTNTQMLFKTYSRYVPNLTRRDGAAFESMLAANGFAKMSHPSAKEEDAA